MAVSIRLPDSVKKRVDKLAAAQDRTSHAFMVDAIREKVDAEEAKAAFVAEARSRLARMKRAGTGIPAREAFDYLAAKAKGASPPRPRTRKTS